MAGSLGELPGTRLVDPPSEPRQAAGAWSMAGVPPNRHAISCVPTQWCLARRGAGADRTVGACAQRSDRRLTALNHADARMLLSGTMANISPPSPSTSSHVAVPAADRGLVHQGTRHLCRRCSCPIGSAHTSTGEFTGLQSIRWRQAATLTVIAWASCATRRASWAAGWSSQNRSTARTPCAPNSRTSDTDRSGISKLRASLSP